MSTLTAQVPLTEPELKLLQTLVYQECGMYFDERRTHFLRDRLQRRLKACQIDSFYSYYRLLTSREGKQELVALLENLTVNETSFFRIRPQLELFQKHVLEELLRRKQERRDWSLRIWSAGCSTGQEPYTLAILICDALAYYYLRNPLPFEMPTPKPLIPPPWKVEIVASDISYSALLTAQQGIYTEAQMDTVDYTCRLRYFDKVGDKYSVKPALKNLVQFDFHNLKTEYLPQRNDAIFCRNVMIYFDEAEQKRLIDKFHRCLNPEGYLFVGHAESLFGLTKRYPHDPPEQRDGVPANRGAAVTFSPDDRASELRDLFFESAEEILQAMNDAGLALEEHPSDKESLRSVRRAVHTLKGDSAACGYRELSELAHELEDVLTPDLVKEHAGLIAEVVLTAADTFRDMLAAYRSNLQPPDGGALREYVQRLLHKPATARREKPAKETAATFNWTEYERLLIAESFRRGETVYQVAMHLAGEAISPAAAYELAKKALERAGKILALRPEDSAEVVSGGLLEAALASSKPADWIRKRCQVPFGGGADFGESYPVAGDGAARRAGHSGGVGSCGGFGERWGRGCCRRRRR